MTEQELIQYGLPILSAIVSAGAWLYGWQGRKHTAQMEDLSALDRRVQELERDASVTRERLHHLPTSTQVNDLTIGLGELKGDIKALTATIVPLERTVGLIDVHLRNLNRPGNER